MRVQTRYNWKLRNQLHKEHKARREKRAKELENEKDTTMFTQSGSITFTKPDQGPAVLPTPVAKSSGDASAMVRQFIEEHGDKVGTEPRRVADIEAVTYNTRGFAQYGHFIDSYGACVRVYESSSAEGPHIWLAIEGGETGNNHGHGHLTIAQAENLIKLLKTAIDHAEKQWT